MSPDLILITGSGFSIPAKYPTVAKLTEMALGRKWPTPGIADLCAFVRAQTSEFVQEWQGGRDANYEDVAFVLRQIQDLDQGELENPLAAAFLHAASEALGREEADIARDARSLLNLIVEDVSDWLWPPGEEYPAEYPSALLEALDGRLCGVVSLNHDLFLERNAPALASGFADGFGRAAGDAVSWWADDFPPDRLPFIKLHGSVDWRRATSPGAKNRTRSGVVSSRGRLICPSQLARDSDIHIHDPAILCGTFNKTMDYHSGIFLDLHWRFMTLLRECSIAVVVGCGFADKAVNSAIIRWMTTDPGRRLLVRDIAPKRMLESARHAISRNMKFWLEDDRAVLDEGCASKLHASSALAALLRL